jgi:ribonucleotide reductase alpha subunit
MGTRERVMLDRYAKRSISGEAKVGDTVIVSVERQFEKDGDTIGSREIGLVERVPNGHNAAPTFSIALKDDNIPTEEWERVLVKRPSFEVLLETSWAEICNRLVGAIRDSGADEEFCAILRRLLQEEAIMPAGRILSGLGRPDLDLTLFNCFVRAIPGDSRGAIADHWKTIFEIFARGGGCGWSMDILRPKGAEVRGVNGRSSGVCSWATHYAEITTTVEQGGSRRGSSLVMLSVWHPDIFDFISFKDRKETFDCPSCDSSIVRDQIVWEGCNISVGLTDDFMAAVKADAAWDLVFPDTTDPDYNTLWDGNLKGWKELGKKVDVYRTVEARELWGAIIEHAWSSGDPGLIFIDRMNKDSNSWYYNRLVATNPCVTGDTVVSLNGELDGKPIEEIVGHDPIKITVDNRVERVGEEQLSQSPHLEGCSVAPVNTVFRSGFKDVNKLTVQKTDASAETVTLKATPSHLIKTPEGWSPLGDLKKGNMVFLANDEIGIVEEQTYHGMEEVFDLVESSTHSFIANGIVVHNCGEQDLPDYGVCNLTHINLGKMVKESRLDDCFPAAETRTLAACELIDWKKLKGSVQAGVRFLNRVIDLNNYHDEKLEEQAKAERRVGLGTFGLAELLMRVGLRYGSEESLTFIGNVYEFIKIHSYQTSVELAKEDGPFPKFDAEKFLQSGFMQRQNDELRNLIKEHGIRNVTLNTVAPTGSVGTMAGTSTGCEPYISLKWTARSRIGATQESINIWEELALKYGNDHKKWPSYVVTSSDVAPLEHVQVMAAIQKHVDASISKTVNLPNDVTIEEVSDVYQALYELGCKGGTVYRDGSKTKQVLYPENLEEEDTDSEMHVSLEVHTMDSPASFVRPKIYNGLCHSDSSKSPVGMVHSFIRHHPETGEPYDFFCTTAKGGDLSADAQAVGRLISLIARMKTPGLSQQAKLQLIADQLVGLRGRGKEGFGPNAIYSFPDAVGKALVKYLKADIPLPGLVLGEDNIDSFVEKLSTCKDKEQMKQFIKSGVVGKHGCGSEECSCKEEETQFSIEDWEKEDSYVSKTQDLCPSCGSATLIQIPGHCTYCTNQQCQYSEC